MELLLKMRCPPVCVNNICQGSSGQVLYQQSLSRTSFTNASEGVLVSDSVTPSFINGSSGQVLTANSTGEPTFQTLPVIPPPPTSVNNINGGNAGNLLYQTAPSTTGFATNGSLDQVLKFVNGVPTFSNPSFKIPVRIEPTLVGPSTIITQDSNLNINNESNFTTFRIALDTPNEKYLQLSINGIKYTSYADNTIGLIYSNGNGTFLKSNQGAEGQVLLIVNNVPTFSNFPFRAPTSVKYTRASTDWETYVSPVGCVLISVTLLAGGGGCGRFQAPSGTTSAGGGGGACFKANFAPGFYQFKIGKGGDGGRTLQPYDESTAGEDSFWRAGSNDAIKITCGGGGGASKAIIGVAAEGGTAGYITNTFPSNLTTILEYPGGNGEGGVLIDILSPLTWFSHGKSGATHFAPMQIRAYEGGGDGIPGTGQGGTFYSGVLGRTGNGACGMIYIEEYYQ